MQGKSYVYKNDKNQRTESRLQHKKGDKSWQEKLKIVDLNRLRSNYLKQKQLWLVETKTWWDFNCRNKIRQMETTKAQNKG